MDGRYGLAWVLMFVGALYGAEPAPTPAATNPTESSSKNEPRWDRERLEGLIRGLAAESYSERKRALEALESAPPTQMREMLQTSRNHEDPEVQEALLEAAHSIFLKKVVKRLPQFKLERGFLGIGWELNTNPPGVTVNQVIANTGAEKAGVKVGDVIVCVDRTQISEVMSMSEVTQMWRGMAPGDHLKLEVERNGEKVTIEAEIGEIPAEYRSGEGAPTDNPERAEALWSKYLRSELAISDDVLQGKPTSAINAPGSPVATTTEPKR